MQAVSESWSRYPNGILVGTSHQMGMYEECVKVHQPVRGQYCIPSVKIGSTAAVDFTAEKTDHRNDDNAWQVILGVSTYKICAHCIRSNPYHYCCDFVTETAGYYLRIQSLERVPK